MYDEYFRAFLFQICQDRMNANVFRIVFKLDIRERSAFDEIGADCFLQW